MLNTDIIWRQAFAAYFVSAWCVLALQNFSCAGAVTSGRGEGAVVPEAAMLESPNTRSAARQTAVSSPAPRVPPRLTPASGQDESRGAGSGSPTALVLARACWGEEGFNVAGCAAVVYVLRARARRVGVDVATMAQRYSSALRGGSARQLLAQRLPAGDEPSWPAEWNRRWARVREVAAGALAGHIANPCPRAAHFGGMTLGPDHNRATRAVREGRWRRVRCRRFEGERPASTYFALVSGVVRADIAAGAAR